MAHVPGTQKVTDEELLERVRECYDAGETLAGGGVARETVAEELPIVTETAEDRLRGLAEDGLLERDWGFDENGKRLGYRPAQDRTVDLRDGEPTDETTHARRNAIMKRRAERELGDDDRELVTDGGTNYSLPAVLAGVTLDWQAEDHSREDCFDDVLAFALATFVDGRAITPRGYDETAKFRPERQALTDGGLERFGVDCPEPEAPTDEIATDTSEDYKFSRPQCRAVTADGERCSNPIERGGSNEFCPRHADTDSETIDDRAEANGGDADVQ